MHKRREHYTLGGCMAELSEVDGRAAGRRARSPSSRRTRRSSIAAVRELGLADRPNVCLARGLKALVGFEPVRFAVIDVGTNSVKFHVGERARRTAAGGRSSTAPR